MEITGQTAPLQANSTLLDFRELEKTYMKHGVLDRSFKWPRLDGEERHTESFSDDQVTWLPRPKSAQLMLGRHQQLSQVTTPPQLHQVGKVEQRLSPLRVISLVNEHIKPECLGSPAFCAHTTMSQLTREGIIMQTLVMENHKTYTRGQ